VVKGHASEVTAMRSVGTGGDMKLITGGKDSKVMVFGGKGSDIKVEKVIDLGESSARGIDYLNGKILVGLRNGNIFEVNEGNENKKLVMASHHEGEAWGLAVVGSSNTLLSIGDDNKILEFDYKEKKFLRKGVISEKPTKNKEKEKKVTASTLSIYPAN
jgi:hypothetical protein